MVPEPASERREDALAEGEARDLRYDHEGDGEEGVCARETGPLLREEEGKAGDPRDHDERVHGVHRSAEDLPHAESETCKSGAATRPLRTSEGDPQLRRGRASFAAAGRLTRLAAA